jgi:hypothetical protein
MYQIFHTFIVKLILIEDFILFFFSLNSWRHAWPLLSQPHFEGSVRSPLTLPKMGLESPLGLESLLGLPKTQSSIARVKTPRLKVFFISLEKFLKCRCPKWPRMIHLDIFSTSCGQKKGRESNYQFDSRLLKVGNQPDPSVCRWSATHRWKALKESYKFAPNLIPIGGLSKKLQMSKVLGVQTGTVLGLHFGSPGKKNHSDVGAAE